MDNKNESYDSVLEKSVGFNNPNNISYLSTLMGINSHCSLMQGLRFVTVSHLKIPSTLHNDFIQKCL